VSAPPTASAPRILIDPGSHHLLNLGDVAMLQVCVDRLRALWPGAEMRVLTAAPELLAQHCPGVTPVDATGRYGLFETRPAARGPRRLARARLALAARRRPAAVAAYAHELLTADLLALSGRGGLTDAFPDESREVLDELELARAIGLPTALLGQGVGPLDDVALRERAARVLPSVGLFTLREGLRGPAILASAGVHAANVVVTGDDAVELAGGGAGSPKPPPRLGVNARVAPYAGIDTEDITALARIAARAAERHGAKLQPIAISAHPAEDDRKAFADLVEPGEPPAPTTPRGVVDAIGGCRAVVVGSYHAAVFALAQGVPAVGLAASPYYADKLHGLRDQFGEGCRVIDLGGPDALDAIEPALDDLWRRADELAVDLRAAAERQAIRGRDAYARLETLL